MCGIAGFFDKSGGTAPIGRYLLQMLEALGDRGPDSTGVAVFGPPIGPDQLILRIKAGEDGTDAPEVFGAIEQRLAPLGTITSHETLGAYLRLVVTLNDMADDYMTEQVAHAVEGTSDGTIELVSAGQSLEIVKQVGTPDQLEATYRISAMTGTHGIGHTRLSTESKIDLSHSQPFWAHGSRDLAVVHNGHITNYHKLRSMYEERGIHFYTHNDSEVIGMYLSDRILQGYSLAEALEASMVELDGSFCYLVATADAFAFVKDSYSFKPLVVAETDEWVGVATEEIALRRALGTGFTAREPAARKIQMWQSPALTALLA